ncbi:DUF5667 domain-containing protein [Clostridium estertheticum]|uniref:DUF5667 domain-containing protein n=1 Tax=Clostridium estertheticum TaxID=238834 RepID=UPI001CF12AAC|nr:DUF5667 domain-containing protein [Clostridium estertheticum]MCB2339336.1 DUF5667 domain-containing protein [Clostridium estertheticum]
MKRVSNLVAAIVFTIIINTQVFAIGVENSNSTSNEININEVVNKETKIITDSIFYFINTGLYNLKLFLNFEDVKKTEIILQIENERLAQCDDMTDKEKYKLAKDMIKELEKGNKLDATRQEYQLVKVSLEQAKKSGDVVAIRVAEELLKEKQSLYKVAIEEEKSVSVPNKVE